MIIINSFAIIVESCCDLPQEYMEEHGVEALPMPFDLDGKAHNEGYWQEISPKDYYDALRRGGVAKTSQVNIETFFSSYKKYAEQGRDALFITLSGALSSTYQNSVVALREIKESYPNCNIYSVDSLTATAGIGLLAMFAVKKRAEGLSAGETAAWLEIKKHSCFGFFTVDDLMYLYRGGRLSKAAAVAGSLLAIKPMLNIGPDGSLQIKEKVRGHKAALRCMVNQLTRGVEPNAELDTVLINHTDCLEEAQNLAELVKAAVNAKRVDIMMMGPIIGAHLGPGAVTLVFEGAVTRQEYENRFYGKK